MTDDLDAMPLPEADRVARQQIEHHRAQMGRWRLRRAERVAAERAGGRSVAEVAEELGVHEQVVYDLLRTARKPDVVDDARE
jgi:DNA-binding CsgD family transcriptional regulator